MKVIIFGATGMVGQGVLRECLLDGEVERVLAVGRTATGQQHEKLREILHHDFLDFSSIEGNLAGCDACFFSLGISSSGMSEQAYRHVTFDFTMSAAQVLGKLNPNITFIYVSGAGADSSERGRVMWARVRGETENALLRLPINVFVLRPAFIQPLDGIRSRTRLYNAFYTLTAPFFPLWKSVLPKYVTTTRDLGRAMIKVAKHGAPKRVLETRDINLIC